MSKNLYKQYQKVGVVKYMNPYTKKLKNVSYIRKFIFEDSSFYGAWYDNILNFPKKLKSKKLLIISTITKLAKNKDNYFNISYKELAKTCKVSVFTISKIMNLLLEANVIEKITTACYKFNSDIFLDKKDTEKFVVIRYRKIDFETISKFIEVIKNNLQPKEIKDFEIKDENDKVIDNLDTRIIETYGHMKLNYLWEDFKINISLWISIHRQSGDFENINWTQLFIEYLACFFK